MARRYEVYGTLGSAIITEPFEPARQIRLVLEEATGEYAAGEHVIEVPLQSRQDLYDRELEAFLAVSAATGGAGQIADAREPCAGDVAALCRYPGVSSMRQITLSRPAALTMLFALSNCDWHVVGRQVIGGVKKSLSTPIPMNSSAR